MYTLYAILGEYKTLQSAVVGLPSAVVAPLSRELGLIPLAEELIDTVNKGDAEWTGSCFTYLSVQIESWLKSLSIGMTIAYIEAEYFGGRGDQCAVVWRDGIEVVPPAKTDGAINQALRLLGVQRENDKDEFDTVGLSRHRSVSEWVQAAGRTLEEDIDRERMIHSWRVTRSHLEDAAELLPETVFVGSSLDTYEEYRNNNEWELALYELERLGDHNNATTEFWVELLLAAEKIGLAELTKELKKRTRVE